MRRAIGWILLGAAVLLLVASARHSAVPAGKGVPRHGGAQRPAEPWNTPTESPRPLGQGLASEWPVTPTSAPSTDRASGVVSADGIVAIDRETADGELLALNGIFRSAYASARAAVLAQSGPVIVAQAGKLTLYHDGQRKEGTDLPPIYSDLKTIAHVPLAIFVMLAPCEAGELSSDKLPELEGLRRKIVSVRAVLRSREFSPEQLARQQEILDLAADYLDGVFERGRFTPEHLRAMTERISPLTVENMAEAARAQIDHYHAQVTAWRNELDADQWASLRVVVMGRQMPRRDNLTIQFFARLLGEPGEGPRIIYAEGLGDQESALALLGTHLIDTAASAAFFGDGQRMHRDLLGDPAKEYLRAERFGPLER